jgi:hypothetical protein
MLQYKNGKKTGYLIDKFSSEFYEARKDARKNKNEKWFKDNTIFDKERYEKRLQSYKDYLQSKFDINLQIKIEELKNAGTYKENKITEIATKFVNKAQSETLNKWIKENNNIYEYNLPVDKWIDSQWREIKLGKYKGTAIEEFYDLYTSTMEEIEEMLPFDIKGNYIADFKRSFLNQIINTGIGNMKLGKSFMESISIGYDEAEINKVNPFTGEYVRNIPILGKKAMPFTEREEFTQNEKSYDLGYSLSVFFESAVRYNELHAIENTVQTARDILLNQKKQLTTSTGQLAKGGFNLTKVSKGLEESLAQFDYFINSTFYGRSEDQGVGVNVKGNSFTEKLGLLKKDDEATISIVKGLNSILRYTGLNNLGYNLFSPVTNLGGGKIMQGLMAIGGRWFSLKDYNFATAVVTAGPFSKLHPDIEKAHLFIDMFKLQSSEYQQELKTKAATGFKGLPEVLRPMGMMAGTEANMQNTGLIAMIKSGKSNIKWDEWEVKNNKLEYIGVNKPSEGELEAFRQKVIHVNGRALGNMNPDDRIRLKQSFLGRAVIQHRGWIPAMLEAHYSDRHYDYQLQEYVEGRVNSLAKYIIKSMNGAKVDEIEKVGAREAITEIGAMIATYLLYAALRGSDEDKERRRRLAYWIRIANRLNGEITFFSPLEFSSKHQILISPAPSISTIEKFGRVLDNIYKVTTGDEEVSKRAQKSTGKKIRQMIPFWSQGERFADEAIIKNIDENK